MAKKKPPRRRGGRPASSASSASPIPPHTPPSSPPRTAISQRPSLPRLLTIEEVADLLRTSRKAIYTQISRGAFPGVLRLSRRLLIDSAQLLQWLDQKRAVSLPTQGEQR